MNSKRSLDSARNDNWVQRHAARRNTAGSRLFSTGTRTSMQRSVMAPSGIAGLRSSFQWQICVFSRLTGMKWALGSFAFFVSNALFLHQNCLAFAMANPLTGPDHEFAGWFTANLTRTFVSVLRAFTEFGSSEWIGVVLFFMVLYFVWKDRKSRVGKECECRWSWC